MREGLIGFVAGLVLRAGPGVCAGSALDAGVLDGVAVGGSSGVGAGEGTPEIEGGRAPIRGALAAGAAVGGRPTNASVPMPPRATIAATATPMNTWSGRTRLDDRPDACGSRGMPQW